jgi:hypothetical protein
MLDDGISAKMVGVISLLHESCDTAAFSVMHPIGGWKREYLGNDWYSKILCGSSENW